MEHTEAVETLAPERYLLNEMMPEDRDAFEEHFFGCADCAAEVRAGAIVAGGVRAMRPKMQSARPRPLTWLATAASLVLAALLGYQNLVTIPPLKLAARQAARGEASQPLSVRVFTLSISKSREATDTVETVPVERGVEPLFQVDIDPIDGATGYEIRLLDARGRNHGAPVRVTGEEAKKSVNFPVGGPLPPGRYSIQVKPEPAGSPAVVKTIDVQ